MGHAGGIGAGLEEAGIAVAAVAGLAAATVAARWLRRHLRWAR